MIWEESSSRKPSPSLQRRSLTKSNTNIQSTYQHTRLYFSARRILATPQLCGTGSSSNIQGFGDGTQTHHPGSPALMRLCKISPMNLPLLSNNSTSTSSGKASLVGSVMSLILSYHKNQLDLCGTGQNDAESMQRIRRCASSMDLQTRLRRS